LITGAFPRIAIAAVEATQTSGLASASVELRQIAEKQSRVGEPIEKKDQQHVTTN